jgi:hypothetical protein
MTRYLLAFLVLLMPISGWAQWSSTHDEPCFGEIGVTDNATAITLTTAGTYYAFELGAVNYGESSGAGYVTTTTNTITVGAHGGGLYRCDFHVCFSGSANTTITTVLRLNGALTKVRIVDKLNASGDVGSKSKAGYLRLVSGDALDLAFSADADSKEVTPCQCCLSIQRMAK